MEAGSKEIFIVEDGLERKLPLRKAGNGMIFRPKEPPPAFDSE